MTSPISKQLTAYLVVGIDTCVEFPVTVAYDKNDPYAVRLGLEADLESDEELLSWTFGRELLGDGLSETTGEGDVQVWPCGPDLVMIELSSDSGSALIAVSARDLRAFLFLSYAEVPPGYESDYLELDRQLHDLMGRA